MKGETELPEACPRCGCALLWNGRGMACISCSYLSTLAKTEMKLPSARSRKRKARDEGAARP